MRVLKLGLIGNGIGKSSAPVLHRRAGEICGLQVSYELLDLIHAPATQFESTFALCAQNGYHGINVTHPYKERVTTHVQMSAAHLRHMGAVNTVRFGNDSAALGFNTDNSGFVRAYRERFGMQAPGTVALVGSGGAGRAVGFALAQLGSSALRLFDLDSTKAAALASALRAASPGLQVWVCDTLAQALDGANGVLNCTQLGMHLYPGNPIPAQLLSGQTWAFDAIYTPRETEFLTGARARGLEIMPGYELFLYQGIDAFEIFSGIQLDASALRLAMSKP